MANISPYLQIIKEATAGEQVRDALINCMNEINKDAAFVVKSKTISGKLSEKGHATYRAAAGEVWKDVTLNITEDDGSEIPQTSVETEDITITNDTPNGELNAPTGKVWGTITVALDFTAGVESIGDNVVISTFDLDGENTWHAEADGRYSAVRSITFSNVDAAKARGGYAGQGGRLVFDIELWNTDASGKPTSKIKDLKAVPDGTLITESPGTNPPAGMMFTGWTPNKVNQAGKYYATYKSSGASIGSISDPWEVIVQNSASYPLGAYKDINVQSSSVKIPYAADKRCFPDLDISDKPEYYNAGFQTRAILVAKGEGGSATTWLTSRVSFSGACSYYFTGSYGFPQHIREYLASNNVQAEDIKNNYQDSLNAKWFNEVFLQYVMPSYIRPHIMPITKYYVTKDFGGSAYYNDTAVHPLWIPSTKEMFIAGWDDNEEMWPSVLQPCLKPEEVERYITNANGELYMQNIGITSGNDRYDLFKYQSVEYDISNRDVWNTGSSGYSHISDSLCFTSKDGVNTTLVNTYQHATYQINNYTGFGFCLDS